MRLIIDVQDSKAAFVRELLENFPFVKVKAEAAKKTRLQAELEEAVNELNLVKAGKKKARKLEDFLHEL